MASISAVARAAKGFVRKSVSVNRLTPSTVCAASAGARALTTEQQFVSSPDTTTTTPLSSDFQQTREAYHQSEEEALQYVSPYQDFFENMQNNGPTTLGTTEEILAFERSRPVKRMACGMPEHVLRFSVVSWGRTLAAPHVMPNEHRVIAKVHTKFLPLNDVEKEILREIVGNRLNDERREFRLTSNQFGSRIENKRHVVSMMDRIILACQRLGAELKEETKASSSSTASAEPDQETSAQ